MTVESEISTDAVPLCVASMRGTSELRMTTPLARTRIAEQDEASTALIVTWDRISHGPV